MFALSQNDLPPNVDCKLVGQMMIGAEAYKGYKTLIQNVEFKGKTYQIEYFVQSTLSNTDLLKDLNTRTAMLNTIKRMLNLAIVYRVGEETKAHKQITELTLSADGTKVKTDAKGEREIEKSLREKYGKVNTKLAATADAAKQELIKTRGKAIEILLGMAPAAPQGAQGQKLGFQKTDPVAPEGAPHEEKKAEKEKTDDKKAPDAQQQMEQFRAEVAQKEAAIKAAAEKLQKDREALREGVEKANQELKARYDEATKKLNEEAAQKEANLRKLAESLEAEKASARKGHEQNRAELQAAQDKIKSDQKAIQEYYERQKTELEAGKKAVEVAFEKRKEALQAEAATLAAEKAHAEIPQPPIAQARLRVVEVKTKKVDKPADQEIDPRFTELQQLLGGLQQEKTWIQLNKLYDDFVKMDRTITVLETTINTLFSQKPDYADFQTLHRLGTVLRGKIGRIQEMIQALPKTYQDSLKALIETWEARNQDILKIVGFDLQTDASFDTEAFIAHLAEARKVTTNWFNPRNNDDYGNLIAGMGRFLKRDVIS